MQLTKLFSKLNTIFQKDLKDTDPPMRRLFLFVCLLCGQLVQVSPEIFVIMSGWGQEPVRKLDESESGQIVLEKVKRAYSGADLCQTMWSHAKKSMTRLKRTTSLFLQSDVGDVRSSFLKTAVYTRETKTTFSQFLIIWTIQDGTRCKV